MNLRYSSALKVAEFNISFHLIHLPFTFFTNQSIFPNFHFILVTYVCLFSQLSKYRLRASARETRDLQIYFKIQSGGSCESCHQSHQSHSEALCNFRINRGAQSLYAPFYGRQVGAPKERLVGPNLDIQSNDDPMIIQSQSNPMIVQ